MNGDGAWACPICNMPVEAGRSVCPGCGLDQNTARSLASGVETSSVSKTISLKPASAKQCIICGGDAGSDDEICQNCRESVGKELGDIDFCRACGAEMQKGQTHCEACGICADPGEEVCPSCGAVRDACSNGCLSCGAKWGSQVTEVTVRAIETSVRGSMEKAKAAGLPVANAEQELQAAVLMLEAGDIEGSCHMLKACDDRLSDLLQQYEIYEGTLKRARAKVEKALHDGIPVARAQTSIAEAEHMGRRKDFREGIQKALHANEIIDKAYADSRGNLVEMGRWKK